MTGSLLALLALSLPVDADSLRAAAREFGVPSLIMLAVATVESGTAGGNHWRGKGRVDGSCKEVGRMQLSPCESWAWLTPWCALAKVRESYSANIRCGAARLAYHRLQLGSWGAAVERYNGRGPKARRYREKVECVLGGLTLAGEP